MRLDYARTMIYRISVIRNLVSEIFFPLSVKSEITKNLARTLESPLLAGSASRVRIFWLHFFLPLI